MELSSLWCVGRNYQEHANEMGQETPSEPIIFLKAGNCRVEQAQTFSLPSWSGEIHHEVELAFEFDKDLNLGRIGIAIDLTARDIQSHLKKNGLPWTLAKSFKHSCPVSPLISIHESEYSLLEFKLFVNGELRQTGKSCDMIFSPNELREYVCSRFPVQPGDLLLTGTPSGVDRVRSGDRLVAEITGKLTCEWIVSSDK